MLLKSAKFAKSSNRSFAVVFFGEVKFLCGPFLSAEDVVLLNAEGEKPSSKPGTLPEANDVKFFFADGGDEALKASLLFTVHASGSSELSLDALDNDKICSLPRCVAVAEVSGSDSFSVKAPSSSV